MTSNGLSPTLDLLDCGEALHTYKVSDEQLNEIPEFDAAEGTNHAGTHSEAGDACDGDEEPQRQMPVDVKEHVIIQGEDNDSNSNETIYILGTHTSTSTDSVVTTPPGNWQLIYNTETKSLCIVQLPTTSTKHHGDTTIGVTPSSHPQLMGTSDASSSEPVCAYSAITARASDCSLVANTLPAVAVRIRPQPGGEHVCPVAGCCSPPFATAAALTCHETVTHVAGCHDPTTPLACPVDGCSRTFIWPTHLRYHLLTHGGERQYWCDVADCGGRFYTAQRLRVHLMTHSGERPFRCAAPGCRKAFTTAGHLKNHTRLHTGDRPYVCRSEGCGRAFTEQSSLKKHQVIHTKAKNFVCDLCGKTFTQSGSRSGHRRRCAEQQTKLCEKEAKRARATESLVELCAFQCEFCLRQFSYKRSKTLHKMKCPAAATTAVNDVSRDATSTVDSHIIEDAASVADQDDNKPEHVADNDVMVVIQIPVDIDAKDETALNDSPLECADQTTKSFATMKDHPLQKVM